MCAFAGGRRLLVRDLQHRGCVRCERFCRLLPLLVFAKRHRRRRRRSAGNPSRRQLLRVRARSLLPEVRRLHQRRIQDDFETLDALVAARERAQVYFGGRRILLYQCSARVRRFSRRILLSQVERALLKRFV